MTQNGFYQVKLPPVLVNNQMLSLKMLIFLGYRIIYNDFKLVGRCPFHILCISFPFPTRN